MPKMSLFIQLNVVGACHNQWLGSTWTLTFSLYVAVSKAKIVEGPTLYISSGSTLNLTCIVRDTPEPPDYIFWYYNGQVSQPPPL